MLQVRDRSSLQERMCPLGPGMGIRRRWSLRDPRAKAMMRSLVLLPLFAKMLKLSFREVDAMLVGFLSTKWVNNSAGYFHINMESNFRNLTSELEV